MSANINEAALAKNASRGMNLSSVFDSSASSPVTSKGRLLDPPVALVALQGAVGELGGLRFCDRTRHR